MKSFKQFLFEANEFSSLNSLLQKYVNGEMPDDFDNEQANPKDLFKQLHDIFDQNGFNMQIIHKGKPFDGSGIVLKTENSLHFDLMSDGKHLEKKLHVELKKRENGDYFFSLVRVE